MYPWTDSIGHDRDVEIRHLAECLGESQFENSALSSVRTGFAWIHVHVVVDDEISGICM